MYAAGEDHPHKQPCIDLLTAIAMGRIDAAIDTELLQEILHRYRSIGRWDDGKRVYDYTRKTMQSVIMIDVSILDKTRQLMDEYTRLMARDALHAAVCIEHEIERICGYDRDFDAIEQINRITPQDLLT